MIRDSGGAFMFSEFFIVWGKVQQKAL